MARLSEDPPFLKGAPQFIIDIWSHSHHGSSITHMDSLSHVSYEGIGYQGRAGKSTVCKESGATFGGIDTLFSGYFTPAVLLDFPTFKNIPFLPAGHEITLEEFKECAKSQGTTVEPGDALLIRTGYNVMTKEERAKGSAGLQPMAALQLREWDVSLYGTDTSGEASPSYDPNFLFPAHVLCLVDLGLCILDNADFESLAQHCKSTKSYRHCFTMNPLRYEGGTGSPVNPIIIK